MEGWQAQQGDNEGSQQCQGRTMNKGDDGEPTATARWDGGDNSIKVMQGGKEDKLTTGRKMIMG